MLEQKVILNQEHANGILSEKDYQRSDGSLSKAYNEERGVINDTATVLKSCRLEKANKDATITIST